jgi:hypothetical protein
MSQILEDFIDAIDTPEEELTDKLSADYSLGPDDYPLQIGVIVSSPLPTYTPEFSIKSFERLLKKFFQEDEYSAVCYYYNVKDLLVFSDGVNREIPSAAKPLKDYGDD